MQYHSRKRRSSEASKETGILCRYRYTRSAQGPRQKQIFAGNRRNRAHLAHMFSERPNAFVRVSCGEPFIDASEIAFARSLDVLRAARQSNQPRRKNSFRAARENLQFQGKNRSRRHLLVEKLDDPLQFRRDDVCYNDKSETACRKVGFDRTPIGVIVERVFAKSLRETCRRVVALVIRGAFRVPVHKAVNAPPAPGVGCIFEQLRHDLTPAACI